MKKRLISSALMLMLFMILAANAFAGELEDRLYKAVLDCNVGQVRALISQGANVNAKVCSPDGKDCEIILNWAYSTDTAAIINRNPDEKDCYDIIGILKKAGANYSAGEAVDKLFADAEKGDVAGVKTILDKGVNVDSRDNSFNATVLMQAASNGQNEVVKLLIARGADVNAVTPNANVTALLWAALNDHPDTALVLIKKGANVNANCGSYTVLTQAVENGDLKFIKMLLANGADVNEKDDSGTALARAYEKIEKGNVTGFDSGFNPTYTPLTRKEKEKYEEIVRILKAAGAHS